MEKKGASLGRRGRPRADGDLPTGQPSPALVLVPAPRARSSGPARRGAVAGLAGSCPHPTWRRGRRVPLSGSRGSGAVRFGSGVTVPSPRLPSPFAAAAAAAAGTFGPGRLGPGPRAPRPLTRGGEQDSLPDGGPSSTLAWFGGPGSPSKQPPTESPPVGDPPLSTKEEWTPAALSP